MSEGSSNFVNQTRVIVMCGRASKNSNFHFPTRFSYFLDLYLCIIALLPTCDYCPGPVMVIKHVVSVLPPRRRLDKHAGDLIINFILFL